MSTCSTCEFWTPRHHGKSGDCTNLGEGKIVHGPTGCPECAPYGTEDCYLLTLPTFGCNEYRKKEEK